MGVRVFTHKRFEESVSEDDRKELIEDFRHYKTTGKTRGVFGRDVPYDRPSSVVFSQLMHVHLADKKINKRIWQNIRIAQQDKTSDSALVYVQGSMDKNAYLLVTIFNLNAHAEARKITLMGELADIAERFRERI